jgi:hypothetical protein
MLVASPVHAYNYQHATAARVSPMARFRGYDLVEWQRIYQRWALGASINDVFGEDCGQIVDGVLFLTPAIFGTTRIGCEIPEGTPILVQAGAAVSEIPTYAATRAEARADARARWSHIVSMGVGVDTAGVHIADSYREAGVYPIRFVRPSQLSFDCVIMEPPCVRDNTPPGPALVATVGTYVMLRPLPPGDHQLSLTVEYTDYTLDLFAGITVR